MTRLRTAAAIVLFAIVCVSGCGTRSVYVPAGDPVRLRQTVRGVAVWVQDADGKWIPGHMDIPEGWYCLPDPGPESEPAE